MFSSFRVTVVVSFVKILNGYRNLLINVRHVALPEYALFQQSQSKTLPRQISIIYNSRYYVLKIF